MAGHSEMMRRQRALADFGDFVLDHEDLDEILNEGCRLIAQALGADLAKVVEIEPGSNTGFVRAGVGWRAGIVGHERVSLSDRSSETYAIEKTEPVITNDVSREERFEFPPFLRDHGVIALVNVPIFLPGRRPWGVLQVDARRPRDFDHEDVEFLKTYAMVLGPVIDRARISAEREQARRGVTEGEERLRQFGEASQDVLWIRDAETLQWQYLTAAFENIYGLSRDEALRGDNYSSWLDLIVPEDRARAERAIARVRDGEHVTFEYRIQRPSDGAIRWLRNTDFPIVNDEGAVGLIGGIGEDITEAKLAQERLQQSEERLRSAVEVGRLGLWDWNVRTGEVHWSDEHFRMEGYAVGEVTPSYESWTARIHPEDRAGAEAALQTAMATREEYTREFRVVFPDGSIHWLSGRGRFFYGEHGQPVRMIGAMVETTERREWEERQKVLVAELQHRTRNLMGVIRSMLEKTARSSAGLADFRERFRDRLESLARVQGLLSRLNEHDRVAFDELIRTELSALHGESERVVLDGPQGVRLRSSTVQTLAMALHELATNAMKYGALGQPSGRLSVTWRLAPEGRDAQPWLHIEWRESGVRVPAVSAVPRGSGEGRELIEKALPYQLGARTAYELGPDSVRCTISVPVSATSME